MRTSPVLVPASRSNSACPLEQASDIVELTVEIKRTFKTMIFEASVSAFFVEWCKIRERMPIIVRTSSVHPSEATAGIR